MLAYCLLHLICLRLKKLEKVILNKYISSLIRFLKSVVYLEFGKIQLFNHYNYHKAAFIIFTIMSLDSCNVIRMELEVEVISSVHGVHYRASNITVSKSQCVPDLVSGNLEIVQA